jgi:hypothetical protein
MTIPALLLLVALAASAAALAGARLAIGSVRGPRFAASRRGGSAAAGVRYAFTWAFLPQAKESASGHLPTYAAGIAYHAGIFAMLARLVSTLAPLALPRPLDLGLAALFAFALAAGLGLLAKRRLTPALRAISVPDDVISNLLVDAALAGALWASLAPGGVQPFQVAGAVLLLYAPLGKLRHMLFLVTSRRLWGQYYGRRGVLP